MEEPSFPADAFLFQFFFFSFLKLNQYRDAYALERRHTFRCRSWIQTRRCVFSLFPRTQIGKTGRQGLTTNETSPGGGAQRTGTRAYADMQGPGDR